MLTKTCDGNTETLQAGHCVVRDLSARQGDPPGAKLCKTYHQYISGMVSHLLGRQARVSDQKIGDTCVLSVLSK